MAINEVIDSEKYRIMFSNDILGFIIQKSEARDYVSIISYLFKKLFLSDKEKQ
jgi:hypothetical protein